MGAVPKSRGRCYHILCAQAEQLLLETLLGNSVLGLAAQVQLIDLLTALLCHLTPAILAVLDNWLDTVNGIPFECIHEPASMSFE